MINNQHAHAERPNRRKTIRLIARGLLGASLAGAASISASARQKHPVPPCNAAAEPSYGAVDSQPTFAVWQDADLMDWQPPRCLGWNGPSQSAQAIAATFRFGGTDSDLLAHIGNLALHPTIKYWSTSRNGWRPLITSAEVVASAEGRPAGAAFAPDDFAVGKINYYAETTAHTGRTIYSLQTLFRSPGRIVLASDNATPIRSLGLTLFHPGALQSVTFLERRSAGLWNYYAIVRAGPGTSRFSVGHSSSYINRLVAVYRFTAGIPTDAEPPAAR